MGRDTEQRITVLLIEDNPGDARLMRQVFAEVKRPAFELVCMERLSTGLQRLAEGGIDVVLLDLSLPDSQGLDTLVRVRAHTPEVPVVVLTGLDDEALAVAAVQKGAQDYLGKGYVQEDSNTLTRSIRYAIERKRVEQELVRLASFPEQNPNPIIETDVTGLITYLNPAARAQFPTLPSVAPRHPLLEGLQAVVARLQQQRTTSLVREIVLNNRVYEQHISSVLGKPLIRIHVVDITERKEVERLKDEFISTVSHELRTPLATFKEFTMILADGLAGPTTPGQQEYLAIMKENVERLVRIVNDLLDIAKLQATRVVLNRQVVEVRALIDQAADSMRPLAAHKQLQLDFQLPHHACTIFADPDKLIQILTNLVGNAIKFTPERGRVTIAVEELANEIQFQVRDTGIGIAAEHLPKLFEEFQQFERPTGGSGAKGTGLGLAISKRLIELHGGRIWAESQRGSGSTFRFTLPKYHVEEVLKEHLKTGIAQAKQRQIAFSIIVVAIAKFHELKARYNPEVIAQLLNELEQLVKETVRQRVGDVVVRWQQGTVILILAEVDRVGCQAIAQRMQQLIESRTVRVGQAEERLRMRTSSVTYPDEALNEEELLRAVEGRLQTIEYPKPRLLVVDDELKIRRFLKDALELRDFEVLTAASGPEALEHLKTQRVDLILLDLLMPVMDGYEVYHLFKENPRTKEIPVIILTGKGERTDRLLGIEGPTYNYVAKPIQMEALVAKIHEALHRTSRA